MTVTDELLAEMESWIDHDVNAIPGSVIDVVLSELRRLRAENAELAKDAGRYEFCRNGDLDLLAKFADPDGHLPCGSAFDAAIDTAMATQ